MAKKKLKDNKYIRCPRLTKMDKIYKLINEAQTKKKNVEFVIDPESQDMIQNILKDVGLEYEVVNSKTKTERLVFKVAPLKDEFPECEEETDPDIDEIFKDIFLM